MNYVVSYTNWICALKKSEVYLRVVPCKLRPESGYASVAHMKSRILSINELRYFRLIGEENQNRGIPQKIKCSAT